MPFPVLEARTSVDLREADAVLAKLAEHFLEGSDLIRGERRCEFRHELGTATACAGEGRLDVRVTSSDATSLAFLQMGIASHVRDFASGERPSIVWQGHNEAGIPLPYFREMRVVSAENVTPRMRRVRLSGERLERFARGGLHVGLLLPRRPGVKPVWPVMGPDGHMAWPEGGEMPVSRVYTIRRIDVEASTIEIDFVLHEGEEMPGASWGAAAAAGDIVGMTGPGGGGIADAAFYLLAGDETALPAIARILEEMPAGKRVVARIEVADAAERQNLQTKADLDLQWLERGGRPAGSTGLLAEAVRDVAIPDGERIFVWAGCEFAAFKEIRSYLRKERGLKRHEHLVVAYWRRNAAGDAARQE